jgi:hypothetical protein
MAKQPENTNETVTPDVAPANLSVADMVALLTTAITQSQAGNQAQLIAALAEIKKPYENPGDKVLAEQMREHNRQAEARKQANIKAAQDACPHLQGCNEMSQRTGDMTSIIKHRLDNNQVVGICTNCTRVFMPGDEDYRKQMGRKSGNQMSQAGQRFSAVMG